MKPVQILRFCKEQKAKIQTAALALLLVAGQTATSYAQDNNNVRIKHHTNEEYGNTLNIGVGPAYFPYLGYTVPFLSLNYEINVARNFTLAPSLGIASYRSYDYYYYAGRRYYYRETVMPLSLKGTYYFDRILNAGPNWDFYLAASLGFNFHSVSWEDGYNGDRGVARDVSPLYLDAHIGAEYHISRSCGLFLDISTGVSTFGLAVHHL